MKVAQKNKEERQQISLHLPKTMYKRLKIKSIEDESSMNSLLLQAVKMILEPTQDEENNHFTEKSVIEMFTPYMSEGDGDPNTSKNIDTILYS